jgi:predicted amino acid dehydrogenase
VEKFAFIIHPIDAKRDVARHKKYAFAKYLPEPAVEWFIKHKDPILASHITGIRSVTGVEAEGWFIACPLTPRQLLGLPLDFVYHRLVQCGKIAEDLGAKIIGLGAFTSVVGDGGVTVAKHLNIPVTTGNSYTVATAMDATIDAAARMEIDLPSATATVVGATGSIGRTCAMLLAPQVRKLVMVGRDRGKLEALLEQFDPKLRSKLVIEDKVGSSLSSSDIVVTVTSAVDVVIEPEHLKIGAVVCDVARPRDVSVRVARERDDVLVVEGGVVQVPGDVDFRFNFGFPPGMAYACMSETMMLALDRKYESFTLGKTVSVEQVNETKRLADKHGFRLAGYRSFEKAVSDDQIGQILVAANRKKKQAQGARDANVGAIS